MKPRSCWSVLAKKAKDEEETAQTAAARARNKVLELQQSRQRMDVLLQDYKQRALVSQAQLQSMSQTTNSRQFLLQLQSLVNRVDEDLRVALRELEQAKTVLLQATHQRMKMETMQEKDLQAVQTWERKRDQKEMDSLGLTLYNLKA
ncbi:MAG: flagellar FliJ family protein [Betaproteobacteria bacterium]|jgi:flagellar export protein FliJ